VTELRTVIVYTTRMEELADWYRRALDLGEWEEAPGHRGQRVGPVYLGFDRVDDPAGSPPSAVTLWFTVDDVEATFERMASMGAEVRYPPTEKPWGDTLASLLDPDGNVIGLAQRR
jgi:uncharacterized glyoxalase superfamily protein PhnB